MSDLPSDHDPDRPALQVRSDGPFYAGLAVIGGAYILLLAGMLLAQLEYASSRNILEKLGKEEIQYSIKLSLITCAITTILSLWVSVPIGYVMSRHEFRGKAFVDSLLDMPIVLPPLVVGLCLLILFNTPLFNSTEEFLHGVELWMSDNLVPLLILAALMVPGILLFALLGRLMPGRLIRAAIVAVPVLGITAIASWDYLFPKMPAWVPVPAEFNQVDVDYRDQTPVRKSRHVYRGRYTFRGTADKLAATFDGRFARENAFELQPMGAGERLKTEGRRRYLLRPRGGESQSRFHGDVVVTIRPPGSPGRLRDLDFSEQPIDWLIEYDIRRPVNESTANFVPKITFPITFEIPAIILAQFMVACAFAVRTMRVTFDQISPRYEQVALTLGCSRSQAFWQVLLPQCRRGMLAAGTLAWARSLGEFGPILIFAGSTRLKTEVLSTTVFLELQVGDLVGAVSASLIMIFSAIIVLVIARVFGLKRAAL